MRQHMLPLRYATLIKALFIIRCFAAAMPLAMALDAGAITPLFSLIMVFMLFHLFRRLPLRHADTPRQLDVTFSPHALHDDFRALIRFLQSC